ncbi:MAG: hypothetical protein UH239_02530 [Acutalibacteraceae bacterium]|nr:hypothetical protein [Acutalibacteraceae bacterium]
MSIKNIKIRFNLDKENDRKAYDYLQNADKSYSKAVISAICEYMELKEKSVNEDTFLERVIATIREETVKANPFGSLLQLVQTQPIQAPVEKEDNTENEETMLDFLDGF